jgi:hypothetical protein
MANIEIRDGDVAEKFLKASGAGTGGDPFIPENATTLLAGSAAIGKLAANTGVDIGDVDVTSIIPGTGTTNLGKAEDAAHTSGDTGVVPLAKRTDSAANSAGTDGDYCTINADANGRIYTNALCTNGGTFAVQVDGNALTALQLIDDIVQTEDAAHSSGNKGVMPLAVRNDAGSALAADGDYIPLMVNSSGALYVTGGGGGTQYTEGDTDASITGTAIMWEDGSDTLRAVSAAKPLPVDLQDASVAVTNAGTFATQVDGAALTALQLIDDGIATTGSAITAKGMAAVGTDGTNARILKTDASGELQVDVLTLPALAAGTNNIGDVDVLSIVPGTGATNLGKAEDAAHTSGDVGVMPLAVRNDAGTALGADGDYTPLTVNSAGALYVTGGGGGTQYQEDTAHASGNTGTMALAVRVDTPSSQTSTDGDYAALITNAYNQLHVSPCAITTVAVTPTVSTSPAYAAGDAVGGKQTFSSATRISAHSGRVKSVIVTDLAKQNAVMDFILFNADPSGTTFTDNSALDVADADVSKIFARVPLVDWCGFNDNSVCAVNNLSLDFKLSSGSSIYGCLITRGTPTFAGTSDIVVTLVIEQD